MTDDELRARNKLAIQYLYRKMLVWQVQGKRKHKRKTKKGNRP